MKKIVYNKFIPITFDIMDGRDGLFLGSMNIDGNKDIIVGYRGCTPVVSKAHVMRIVTSRRPTLRNVVIDICPRNNSFVLDKLD